jgi:hypothetical protein
MPNRHRAIFSTVLSLEVPPLPQDFGFPPILLLLPKMLLDPSSYLPWDLVHGLGVWAWGDSVFWKYDKKGDEELCNVFDNVVDKMTSPISFDTAELFGFGCSEKLIGEFSKSFLQDKVEIATRLTLRRSKQKLTLSLVDRLGGCHPIKLYSTSTAVNQ